MSSNGDRQNIVTLSADERDIAKLNGLTDEQYAKNKLTLMREGRMGNGR